MAVLLTYHKLVERDEKNVQMHWKVSSMLLLILGVFFSFCIAVSMQSLINDYEGRCVLGAEVKIISVEPPKNLTSSEITFEETSELNTFFNESYSQFLSLGRGKKYLSADLKFLAEHELDMQQSSWGQQTTCDYAIYIPLSQCLFSVIMVVMFAICGRGGKSEPNAFLPQPWRIVTPALFFNIIMTILSIIGTTIVESGLNEFCKSLISETPDISCSVALNRYMLIPYEKVLIPPSVERNLLTSFGFINLGIWVLSVAILIARIIFVVDFQLIKVTVKTKEYENNKKDKMDEEMYEDDGNATQC